MSGGKQGTFNIVCQGISEISFNTMTIVMFFLVKVLYIEVFTKFLAMKSIIIFLVSIFIFNSCTTPEKQETQNQEKSVPQKEVKKQVIEEKIINSETQLELDFG